MFEISNIGSMTSAGGAKKVAKAGEKYNNSIMDSMTTSSSDSTPKEIAQNFVKAIESKKPEEIIKALGGIKSNNISKVMKEYEALTKRNLVNDINQANISPKVKSEILAHLKQLGRTNTYAGNSLLANDLMNTLNGKDKNKIAALINNELKPENINGVYNKYNQLARQRKETAGSKEEISIIKHGGSRSAKKGAARPETLFQGVLNNNALSLDEKKKYLNILVDKFAEYGKKNGVSETDVSGFVNSARKEIENILKVQNPAINNALDLEKMLNERIGKNLKF